MNNFFRTIIIFISLSIALFSPLFLYNAIVHGKNIYYSSYYVRVKIKVDSIKAEANNAGDGNASVDAYHIYNDEYNLKFSFTDRRGDLIGDDGVISNMFNYMKLHQDSILIWYNPKAEIKYAREDESAVSTTEEFLYLAINSILVVIAVLYIHWLVQYYKNKKTDKGMIKNNLLFFIVVCHTVLSQRSESNIIVGYSEIQEMYFHECTPALKMKADYTELSQVRNQYPEQLMQSILSATSQEWVDYNTLGGAEKSSRLNMMILNYLKLNT